VPEERLLGEEARERIAAAIVALPENYRAVITLRDVDGFDATEACEILGISEANQRVLLHRARARVRAALEDYIDEEAA
jgi:RNA polymerase sigma-70 factor (ECF subfamily)